MVFDVVICDEAHRIGNPKTQLYKALKKIQSSRKIAMTGTPMQNSPTDFFGIINWLSPGFFGTFYQFCEKYCIIDPRFHRIVAYKNMKDLSDRISRFMLRHTKVEVFDDFPKKIIQDILFELSPEEKELYVGIQKEIADDIAKLNINSQTLSLIPVKMLRLLQVVDDPRLIGSTVKSSKLKVLLDILESNLYGQTKNKAVIFTRFAEEAKILFKELSEYNPFLITGETPVVERQQIIKEFNTDNEHLILIGTEAIGLGINAQRANCVINYDLPWSVSKLTQRIDRVHRIGQSQIVNAYNLLAKNTIDEYIGRVLYKKQKTAVNLMKDDERLTKLGLAVDDIKAILRI